MFKRPHHQRVAKVLHACNRDLLQEAECYFGGGTAIVLSLDEYRESVDIDFLCASNDGYRLLRNTVSQDLGQLLTEPIKHLREVRADRHKKFYRSTEMVADAPYLSSCLHKMQMNADLIARISAVLKAAAANIPIGIDA